MACSNITLTVPLALGSISLQAPHPSALSQQAGAPAYRARLWPAAVAMAQHLQQQPQLVAGRTVLELGAGLAVPSLVAARFARRVYCTDAAPAAVALAAANGRRLHLQATLRCRVFNWNHLTTLSRVPQVLLLSDVNYEPAAFDQLLAGIQHARRLGAEVWLSTPQRLSAIPFVEALLPACSLHLQQAVQLPHEAGTTMVSLLQLQAKK